MREHLVARLAFLLLAGAAASCGGGGVSGGQVEAAAPPEDGGGFRARPWEPSEAWKEYRERVAAARRTGFDPSPYVHQPGSELVWTRCPIGARWSGTTCAGEAAPLGAMSFAQACPRGFRAPTVEEYRLLLGDCDSRAGRVEAGMCRSCYRSSTCEGMFGEDRAWYWAGQGFLAHAAVQGAWAVSLEYGYFHFVEMGEDRTAELRCVRRIEKTPERREEPTRRSP